MAVFYGREWLVCVDYFCVLFLEILQYAECVVNMLIYWCYIY